MGNLKSALVIRRDIIGTNIEPYRLPVKEQAGSAVRPAEYQRLAAVGVQSNAMRAPTKGRVFTPCIAVTSHAIINHKLKLSILWAIIIVQTESGVRGKAQMANYRKA